MPPSVPMPDPKTWYYIQHDSGFVLDVRGGKKGRGIPVWLYSKNGSNARKWKFLANGHIQNALGFYLDVKGSNPNPQTPLWVWDRNDSTAQKWAYNTIDRSLVPHQVNTNLAMDVQGNIVQEATVWTYSKNGASTQRWTFVAV